MKENNSLTTLLTLFEDCLLAKSDPEGKELDGWDTSGAGAGLDTGTGTNTGTE